MKVRSVNLLALGLLLFLAISASAATFTVTKVADTNDGVCDSDCSLREAIAAANAGPGDDMIVFHASLFGVQQTITLSGSEIVINNSGSLTITGPGAGLLTISGNKLSRIIRNTPGSVASISGMTLTEGNGASTVINFSGGAVLNDAGNLTLYRMIITNNATSNSGGAIRNSGPGELTVDECIVSNNSSGGDGGGVENLGSTLSVSNSTFTGNLSSGGSFRGGAIQVGGTARITNSTFAENTSAGTSSPTSGGGGALNVNGVSVIITNVTIAGNTSSNNGGGIHRSSSNPNLFIRNSIVAGNTGTGTSPDITNSANGIQSQGNNIIANVGTSTGWIASDLLDTIPLLGALADNGGFGRTILPQNGSPAIDAGQACILDSSCKANNPPFNVIVDQRGVARPAGAGIDIGAVEGNPAVVAGRVAAPSGFGLPHATVTVTAGTNVWIARTSSFGYFRFGGLPTGVTYTVTVSDKRVTYGSTAVVLTGDVIDLEISPQRPTAR